MAARRQSDFIAMLVDIGHSGSDPTATTITRNPSEVCDETIQTVQMTIDSLLLTERDMPLSDQSFHASCDTIIAGSKQVVYWAISTHRVLERSHRSR
jgi:hypothetical protein